MALPTCPDLASQSVTTNTASGSLAAYIDAAFTSLTAATDDAGNAIPAARQWNCTKSGASDYIVGEPNAASAMAGKVVFLLAGASAQTPQAAAMLTPDTQSASFLYFGLWMANTSAGALQTVGKADLTNATSWRTDNVPFGGNGTWSGYWKLYGATACAKAIVFATAETVDFQLEDTSQGVFSCGGGFGIRGVSTDAADSEAGTLGRLFSFYTTGSSASTNSTFLTNGSSGLLKHDTTNGSWHSAYRIPAATTNASNVTMRTVSWTAQGTGAPMWFASSTANQGMSAGGNAEPETVVLRDVVGSGGRNNMTIGRSRVFFLGPRRKSKAILSTGGTKKWISFGSSLVSDNDNFLIPM